MTSVSPGKGEGEEELRERLRRPGSEVTGSEAGRGPGWEEIASFLGGRGAIVGSRMVSVFVSVWEEITSFLGGRGAIVGSRMVSVFVSVLALPKKLNLNISSFFSMYTPALMLSNSHEPDHDSQLNCITEIEALLKEIPSSAQKLSRLVRSRNGNDNLSISF